MLRDLNLTFGVAQLTIHCAHEDTEALGVQGRNPPQRRARGIWLPSSSASQNVKTAVFVGPPPQHTPQEEAEEIDITQRCPSPLHWVTDSG